MFTVRTMTPSARALTGAAFFAALFAGTSAHAAETEARDVGYRIGAPPAHYLLGGVTTGASVVGPERGGYVGGEVSFVRLHEGRVLGVYGDGYYDFGVKRTYATGGLEIGYRFLGFDGGIASRFGGDAPELGPTGRVFLSLGLFSLYTRYAYFADAPRDEHVVQVGALFKLPFFTASARGE
jgi:hypothetical protein